MGRDSKHDAIRDFLENFSGDVDPAYLPEVRASAGDDLQAKIDAAKGGRLILKDDTYREIDQLTANNVYIDARGATFEPTDVGATGTGDDSATILIDGSNVRIDGLEIDGSKLTDGRREGIRCDQNQGIENVWVENCYFHDNLETGVNWKDAKYVWIQNCRAENNMGYGFAAQGDGGGEHVFIEGCYVENNDKTAFQFPGQEHVHVTDCENHNSSAGMFGIAAVKHITIDNCTCDGSLRFINEEDVPASPPFMSDVVISNCTVENTGSDAMFTHGSFRMSNTTFFNQSNRAINAQQDSPSEDIGLVNCEFRGSGAEVLIRSEGEARIANCDWYDVDPSSDISLNLQTEATVVGCGFHNCNEAIRVADDRAGKTTIGLCRFENNAGNCVRVRPPNGETIEDVLVYGNIFDENGSEDVFMDSGTGGTPSGVRVVHNVIRHTSRSNNAILSNNGATGTVVRYNKIGDSLSISLNGSDETLGPQTGYVTRNSGVETDAVAIGSGDSTGDVTVSVTHGMDETPTTFDTWLEAASATDYVAFVKEVRSIGSNSFDVVVHIDSLASTTGETVDLGWEATFR